MLHRARAVRLLVADRGDDAHLRILPADDADARRLAQARRAPVGSHQQRRAQVPAVRKGNRDAVLVGGIAGGRGTAQEGNGRPPHGRAEYGGRQALVLHDVGGGLAALDGVVVGDEDGAERIFQTWHR